MKKFITTFAVLFGINALAVLVLSLFIPISWDFAVGFLIVVGLLGSSAKEYKDTGKLNAMMSLFASTAIAFMILSFFTSISWDLIIGLLYVLALVGALASDYSESETPHHGHGL